MKFWLTFITSGGNEENLKELIEPVKSYFDGIVATFHFPIDAGAAYLENNKGAGKIIYREWIQRHEVSMNETLWAGVIQEDDYVCIVDTLERISPQFLDKFKKDLIVMMNNNQIDSIAYYGKTFIFKYNEFATYRGSPHWGLVGMQGRVVDYSQVEPDESKVRLNVRPQKRTDPFNWVGHYLKYHLYPPGSNHSLLGLDTYGEPHKLFPEREGKRLMFRKELKKRGFPITVAGVKNLFGGPLDQTLKDFINGEKILADYYQYEILGNKNIIHSHLPKDIIKVN